MIVCVAPCVRDDFKSIRRAIVVRVADARQLAALCNVERFVFVRQAEDLIEARREQMK